MKEVILMRGVSGSGKSSFIKERYPDATIVSADKFFETSEGYNFDETQIRAAHNYSQTEFLKALNERRELIVVDNTNTTPWQMRFYLDKAKEKGYEVRGIYLHVPELAIVENRNLHGVSSEKLKLQYENLMKEGSFPTDLPTELWWVENGKWTKEVGGTESGEEVKLNRR